VSQPRGPHTNYISIRHANTVQLFFNSLYKRLFATTVKHRLFQVLTEPEKAAKRKIKKHLKKREAKKKKIENIKGRKFVKKKRKEFKIEDI
jgi:hypothetical protein